MLTAIVLYLSSLYLSSTAWPKGRATLVGVVLPSHARPGTLISGLVVVNPDDYEGIPGLKVVRTEIPLAKDSSEQIALREVSIETGDGVKQRADRSFTARVGADGGVPLAITNSRSQQGTQRLRATVENATTAAGETRGYAMLPVTSDSGVMVIHGSFSGDARGTAISLNGQPVKKLAETSDAAYFEVPQTTRPGRNHVELREGARSASLDLFAPSLTIRAGQTKLERGQSTEFHVNVSGLDQLPASAWRAGTPSELFDLGALRDKVSALKETPPSKDGALVLLIENKSPDIVNMAPQNAVAVSITRSDLKDGSFEYTGTLTATQTGEYVLEATLVPLLAETVAETTAVAAQTDTGAMSNNAGSAGDCDNKWIKDETIASSGGRAGLDQEVQARAQELEGKFSCTSKNCSEDQKCVFKTATYNLQALPGTRGEWAEGVRFGCFCKSAPGGGTVSRKATPTPTVVYETPAPTPEPTEIETGLPPPLLPTSRERSPTPGPTTVETPNPTPTEYPTVVESYSPTPNPTPTIIGCPQLHRGCAALVIDIMRNNDWVMADASALPPVLKNAGCVVDYVAPDFWRVPHPYTLDAALIKPSQEKVDEANAHNFTEWNRVLEAIYTHADRVSAGKSLAIEIINAHGGLPSTVSETGRLLCGFWSTQFDASMVLSRNDLIGKMYGVANHNVCSWVMYDSSCYSGYTPMGMDEAENEIMMSGIPLCESASLVSCPRHAGYDLDSAAGAAVASEMSRNGASFVRLQSLKSTLGSAPGNFSEMGKALGKFMSNRSSNYTDQGYEGDIPPPRQHPHSGY